ncbi:MAG: SulP family inorganic anion transporter, partial [Clostridiales Family XIII bacterium]|nr:SulP family inorganic anion transporter [Clostridiales Family XIII bacterium]
MVKRYVQDIRREFKGYNGSTLKNDLLAGLTVTAVALPLALAFGIGSGATAQSGLITAIIAGSIIAIFAGASSQISGPTGAMMAILILMVQDYGINSIFVAGVMSGIVLILCGVLRLGKVVTFIPAPVVIGFTSGIALVIAIGQIDNFLGAKTPGAESTALKFVGYFTHPFTPNPYAIGVALAVMLIMILWPKKWQAILPSSLVALIVVSAVSILANFPVDTIGEIPKSLLPKDRLDIFGIDFSLIKKMLVPCLSIAALNMMETLMCGEIGAKEKHEKYDPNRDLVSQGIGNIILPFFGGVPATAAIARSSVGIKSGGKTRLVSIFHA